MVPVLCLGLCSLLAQAAATDRLPVAPETLGTAQATAAAAMSAPETTSTDAPAALLVVPPSLESVTFPAPEAKVTDEDAVPRTLAAERYHLSWVTSAGPGRFNLIDWESQVNWDRLWWLGNWPSAETFHLTPALQFNIHWWAGPVSRDGRPAPDLPPRVYDLYVDLTWAQKWTDRFATQVRFAPGLYTDFRTTPPDAFRVPGEAVGVLQLVPQLWLVGGLEHLQRDRIKILPVAGVLWQPTPHCELRLVFPEPKIAVELSTRHHVWGYLSGEYGGGRWTFKNDLGHSERVELSDVRLMAGIEWHDGLLGKLPLASTDAASFVELGYVFDRRLRFDSVDESFNPDAGWMIRFGRNW